jgi:hypothetical protein
MGKGDHTRVSVTAFPGDEIDRVHRESFKDSVQLRQQRQNRSNWAKKGAANEEKKRRAKEDKEIALKLANQLQQKATSGNMPMAQRVRKAWPLDRKTPALRTIYNYLAK